MPSTKHAPLHDRPKSLSLAISQGINGNYSPLPHPPVDELTLQCAHLTSQQREQVLGLLEQMLNFGKKA